VYVAYGAVPKDNYDGAKENVYLDVFRMALPGAQQLTRSSSRSSSD